MIKRKLSSRPRRAWTRHPATRVKTSGKLYRRDREKRVSPEEEFVDSLWTTMKKQERDRPEMALLHERLDDSVLLVGLTGGIASGKSAVASLFQKAGIPVIDADRIAREVTRPNRPAFLAVIASFGEGILSPDGTIDRGKLGSIVFSDAARRKLLESITHPEILKELIHQIREKKKKKGVRAIVVDAALLFESGLASVMHRTVLVRVSPETQLKRLMKRDRLPEVEAWQRILAQMPTAEKEPHADFVIDNSGAPAETARAVQELLTRLIS